MVVQPPSLSGKKFQDNNGDGIENDADAGLAGWVINVYADANGNGLLEAADDGTADGMFTVLATTTTATQAQANANPNDLLVNAGDYSSRANPGSYIVCEVMQPGWTQTFPTSGPTCPNGTIGYAVVVDLGVSVSGRDFRNVQQCKAGSLSRSRLIPTAASRRLSSTRTTAQLQPGRQWPERQRPPDAGQLHGSGTGRGRLGPHQYPDRQR